MSRNNPDFRAVTEGTVRRLADKKVLADNLIERTITTVTIGTLPTYFQQGDFTIALLQNVDTNEALAVGVSKRNPTDQKNLLRGRSLALSRAVKEFVVKTVLKEEKFVIEKPESKASGASRFQQDYARVI